MIRRTTLVLALMFSFLTITAPAQAWPTLKACVGLPITPQYHPVGYIGKGGTKCVGWSGNRVETKVWLEERWGTGDKFRWILAERKSSAYGVDGNKGYWIMRKQSGTVILRTCVSAEVIGNKGTVIKRFGKTCSPKREL